MSKRLLTSARPVAVTATDGQPTPTFRGVAYTGEAMLIGFWDSPVVVDLDSIDLTALPIPALYDHCPDADYVVGQCDSVAVEGGRLVVSGPVIVPDLPPERNRAKQVLDKARAGYSWQLSVGGDPTTTEKVPAGQSVQVNGRTYPGPVTVARGVVLREVSFVVLGGDRRTSAVVARRRQIQGAAMSFEDWLTAMGFDSAAQAAMTEIQLANMKLLYAEETGEGEVPEEGDTPDPNAPPANAAGDPPAAPGTPPANAGASQPRMRGDRRRRATDNVAAYRREMAKEENRQAAIRAIAAKHGVTEVEVAGADGKPTKVLLVPHAIEHNWTPDQAELAALRAARPAGPAVFSHGKEKDCTVQALQGAMILRAGGRLDSPHYRTQGAVALRLPEWLRAGPNPDQSARIMEAAHRYSDMSLVDLCRECLRLDGQQVPHGRQESIRAAFSGGGNLLYVFTTNVNATVIDSYYEAEDTTQGWTRDEDVADFRLQDHIQLDPVATLNILPPTAEADHIKASDKHEQYKIARYARQGVFDEQDVINDRLGVFGEIPRQAGLAAMRLRPDLVYSVLLSNPTLTATGRALFNSTDGNAVTTSALAADKLQASIATMQVITTTDSEGNVVNLNLEPTHILVPPSLKHLTWQLLNSSQLLIAGTAGSVTTVGNMNPIMGDQLTPVSDARLQNGVRDPQTRTLYSGSTSTWYLVSNMAPTIVVGYLRGTGRAPQTRTWKLSEGKWGFGFDVKHDIGAGAMDWRGLQKNTA